MRGDRLEDRGAGAHRHCKRQLQIMWRTEHIRDRVPIGVRPIDPRRILAGDLWLPAKSLPLHFLRIVLHAAFVCRRLKCPSADLSVPMPSKQALYRCVNRRRPKSRLMPASQRPQLPSSTAPKLASAAASL